MQGYTGQDKCKKCDSIRIMPEYGHMLDSGKDKLFAVPPPVLLQHPTHEEGSVRSHVRPSQVLWLYK